jgi:hypothetical protein
MDVLVAGFDLRDILLRQARPLSQLSLRSNRARARPSFWDDHLPNRESRFDATGSYRRHPALPLLPRQSSGIVGRLPGPPGQPASYQSATASS